MYFSKSLNLPRIRENEISRGIQRATSTILISVNYVCYMLLYVQQIRYQWMRRHTCWQLYIFKLAPIRSCTAGVCDFRMRRVLERYAIFTCSCSINRRCHLVVVVGGEVTRLDTATVINSVLDYTCMHR